MLLGAAVVLAAAGWLAAFTEAGVGLLLGAVALAAIAGMVGGRMRHLALSLGALVVAPIAVTLIVNVGAWALRGFEGPGGASTEAPRTPR